MENLANNVNDHGAKLRLRFPMLNESELSLLERQFEESEFYVKPYDAEEDKRVLTLNYNQGNTKSGGPSDLVF